MINYREVINYTLIDAIFYHRFSYFCNVHSAIYVITGAYLILNGNIFTHVCVLNSWVFWRSSVCL